MWFYNHITYISIMTILLYMKLIYFETPIPKHSMQFSWEQRSFPKSTRLVIANYNIITRTGTNDICRFRNKHNSHLMPILVGKKSAEFQYSAQKISSIERTLPISLSQEKSLPLLGTTHTESDFILIVIVYIPISLKSSGKPFKSHTMRLKLTWKQAFIPQMLSSSPSINKMGKIPDLRRFIFSGYRFKGEG